MCCFYFQFAGLPSHAHHSFSGLSLHPRVSKIKGSLNIAMSSSTHVVRNSVEQHKIIIANKYGEKLVGILHEAGSMEIIILCHGFCSSKENRTTVNLAVALGGEGFSSFRFDFAGNGESEGQFQYGNYWREVDDLRAVIEYFRESSRAIHAIVGHSKGGNVVLLYGSRYHDIHMIVNISGRYNLNAGIEERLGQENLRRIEEDGFVDVTSKTGQIKFRVTKESLMDRLNTNMHESCLQIAKHCRVLTIHGFMDEVVPAGDAMEFAKIIPNHSLHIIEGADHCYDSEEAKLELSCVVVRFLKGGVQRNR